ncbi:response regulator [Parasulfuritortus cantonensis]|uniref:response regulator n=1 Tax=Parasulfuritortus cantonensis TaxID=2528202 RepID=UPI001F0D917C|nr:response regulator [Parasulfuritortus cantonensis]
MNAPAAVPPLGRLLVVDDERVALRNIEHVLKRAGHEVTATTSGTNALNLLEKNVYDVVLTDLRMDKVDGMEVLRRCRELAPDAEVIMITGHASLDSAVAAMKEGPSTTSPSRTGSTRCARWSARPWTRCA